MAAVAPEDPDADRGAGPTTHSGRVPTICLIGATGAGKSSTGNTFFKHQDNTLFPVSDGMQSTTFETKAVTLRWRGRDDLVRCVDTPGLGDTAGRDTDHVSSMVDYLKGVVQYVHVFLVLFNGEETKLNIYLKGMLEIFRNTFGSEFLKHVMIGFTHWEFDKRSAARRRKNGVTKEQKGRMVNEELQKLLHHDFDCPCVFLDNTLNVCSEEELRDMYDDELASVLSKFEEELEQIHLQLRGDKPFLCGRIQAAICQSDALGRSFRDWLELSHLTSAKDLGRNLIVAEQDVMNKGWLRWRRQSVYGVLRRQHLYFYRDDSCQQPVPPEHIELMGCICSVGYKPFVGGWYFIIYRPLDKFAADWRGDPSADVCDDFFEPYRPCFGASGAYDEYEFGVPTEMERSKWVLLVGEATQASESYHRINKFYQAMRAAKTTGEYVKAVETVSNKTMVIPVEWVRQFQADSRTLKEVTVAQTEKELQRDRVLVEGRLFQLPKVETLALEIQRQVLQSMGSLDRQGESQGLISAKAAVLARDVVLSCARSSGVGDIYEALHMLFGGDLVHLNPEDGKAAEAIRVRVLGADEAAQESTSPQSGDVENERHQTVSTGLPEFSCDDSATRLDMDRVRRMVLDGEQKIQTTAVDQSKWVADAEFQQCFRCGVNFMPWLRRHHCRACGVLICFNCGRHRVQLAPPGPRTANNGSDLRSLVANFEQGKQKPVRVCFLCYQKQFIMDLNARKDQGDCPAAKLKDLDNESVDAPPLIAGVPRQRTPSSDSAPEASSATIVWPEISVEFSSRYKVCSANPTSEEDAVLFELNCQYVRVVRWSGLADSGRIFISMEMG